MLEEEMLEQDALEPQDSDKETPKAEIEEPEDVKTPSSGGFGGSFGGSFGGGFGGGFGETPQEKILLLQDLRGCREDLRLSIRRSETEPQINDQDRLAPDDPQQVDDFLSRVGI